MDNELENILDSIMFDYEESIKDGDMITIKE